MLKRQVQPEAHHFLVSAADAEMQETERIEHGMRHALEGFDHDLLCDLRGARAFGMATHAIDREQQRGVLGHYRNGLVLVVFPGSEEADVGVIDVQGSVRALLDWARFISRPAIPSA